MPTPCSNTKWRPVREPTDPLDPESLGMKTGAILVAADILGPNLLSDPEVQVPRKPRLPPEIVVLPFGPRGILLEGSKTTQVLSGSSARTLLPAVLEQLDGTKTVEEIAAAIP